VPIFGNTFQEVESGYTPKDNRNPSDLIREQIEGPSAPHSELKRVKILALFTSSAKTQVKKSGDLIRYLTGFDVILQISTGDWLLYEECIDAFVDHLLTHIEPDGTGNVAIAKPEIQEFKDVLARRGAWRQPVRDRQEVAFQVDGEGTEVG